MTHLRNEHGHLLPGQRSINPSGRPPIDPAIKAETNAILHAATPKAARRLAQLVDSSDERIAAMASEMILARVFGKPVQQLDAKIETTNVQQAHLAILMELQHRRDPGDEARPSREAETVEAIDVTPAPAPAPAPIATGDAPSAPGEDSNAGGEVSDADVGSAVLRAYRRRLQQNTPRRKADPAPGAA